MNFVYIHTHDTGRYIQPYGIQADNPGLSRLAKEGVIFRNMYCCAPTCSPSRAAMLTGTAPHNCGMLGLAHRGFALERPEEHLASYLRSNGYYTCLFGVQHEAHKEGISKLGYCSITNKVGKNSVETDENNSIAVCDFLKERTGDNGSFFISFGMNNTHRGWPKAKDPQPDFVVPPFPVADTPENRLEYCNYLESLSVVDRCVTRVFDAIEQSGHKDDTVVLFTTDHGLAYPNMKCNLYDTGTGVSFILRIPGVEHSACDALCSHIDLYPTVCDLLGLEKPVHLQGRSLMPLLNKTADEVNEFVFSEVTFHATYQPMRSVRSKRFKLIRFYDGGNQQRFSNIDQGVAKKLYVSTELSRKDRPCELFFDLYADPTERIDLSADPSYADEYKRHCDALENWQKKTNDPVYYGASMIEMGKGKLMNSFDAPDPSPATSFVIE